MIVDTHLAALAFLLLPLLAMAREVREIDVGRPESMEKKVMVAIVLMGALALMLLGYAINEPNRQAAAKVRLEEVAIERGVQTYATLCYPCHGADGRGAVVPPGGENIVVAPALNRPDFQHENVEAAQDTYNFLFRTIARGRPNTPMPAWSVHEGGQLNDEEIHELVLFIMKGDWSEAQALVNEAVAQGAPTPIPVPTVTLPEPAATGARLFSEKGCIGCHTVGNVGGRTGPNLTDIATVGAQRKPGMSAEEYIKESIRQPSAFVVEGFPPVMPPIPVTDEELEALVAYLLAEK
ncbi:MAG TPA: cytochrome c [Chloroflexota bacterium]